VREGDWRQAKLIGVAAFIKTAIIEVGLTSKVGDTLPRPVIVIRNSEDSFVYRICICKRQVVILRAVLCIAVLHEKRIIGKFPTSTLSFGEVTGNATFQEHRNRPLILALLDSGTASVNNGRVQRLSST
jgi:hypothetical protein